MPAPHEVAFVPSRLVRRPIDGGGLSGLACRSPWPARSTHEAAADVNMNALRGVHVAYPLCAVSSVRLSVKVSMAGRDTLTSQLPQGIFM